MDTTSPSQSLISWQYRTAIKPKVRQVQNLFVRHSFCDQGIFNFFIPCRGGSIVRGGFTKGKMGVHKGWKCEQDEKMI